MLEVDRTVVGGARLSAGEWAPWQPPCRDAGGPAKLAASTPLDLVAVCDEGVWTGLTVSVRSYLSSDAGTTFRQTAVALAGLCCTGAVASGRPGTAVVAGNLAGGPAVLKATFDQGASWATVLTGPDNRSWLELGFTSASQGVAISKADQGSQSTLYMTFDGGHTWRPVAIR